MDWGAVVFGIQKLLQSKGVDLHQFMRSHVTIHRLHNNNNQDYAIDLWKLRGHWMGNGDVVKSILVLRLMENQFPSSAIHFGRTIGRFAEEKVCRNYLPFNYIKLFSNTGCPSIPSPVQQLLLLLVGYFRTNYSTNGSILMDEELVLLAL